MKNLFLHTFLAAALLTGTSLNKPVLAQTLDYGSGSGNVTNFEDIAAEGDKTTGTGWPENKSSSSTVSDSYGETKTVITTGTIDSGNGLSGIITDSGTTNSGSSGSGTTAGSSGGSGSGSSSGSEKANSTKAEDATKYTGVFNERQIVPNSMAIYCKTNAEDMVKDSKKLYDCINLIAQKINDKDTAVRDENRLHYEEIRYEELKTLMSQAVAKGASISNYEKIQNEIGDASGKTQTEHEDNVAIANTLSTLTDVINTMRDLYAERLKNEAISGISSISPGVIANMAKNTAESSESGTKNESSSAGSGERSGKGTQTTDSTEVKITETSPKTSDPEWLEGNNCTRRVCSGEDNCNNETIPCPNGTYPVTGTGYSMICFMGKCIKYDIDNLCTDESLKKINKKLNSASDGKCDYGDGNEVTCEDGIYSNGYVCLNGTCKSCKEELQ